MVGTASTTRIGVSVYLLKKSKLNEAQNELIDAAVDLFELAEPFSDAFLLTLPAEPAPPRWLAPVAALLPSGSTQPELVGTALGALLWLPRPPYTFVLTFGYAHAKVKAEWVEPEFGKVVALALVPQGQVREVRAEQVFARRHIASERAPRAAAVREFGFEPDRDLVSAVEGVPATAHTAMFGTKVRGGVSFKFDVDFHNLAAALDQIIERYESDDHLSQWPEAQNLVQVRDEDTLLKLDALLDVVLAAPHPEKHVALAAPGERSGDKPYPQNFVIGRNTAGNATSPYLMFSTWEKLLTTKGEQPSTGTAKSTRVHLLDEDKEKIDDCSMYACMGVDVDLAGITHVLSSGTWYAANKDFVDTTNKSIAGVMSPAITLSAWNQADNEGPYNEKAVAAGADLWLFDKALVGFGGGHSRLEFCDVMHLASKTLYFVKHPSGSAGVSHLCEQVRRTAEAFFDMDSSFRKKLEERVNALGKGWDTAWLAAQPKRHEWHLCLVLMGKQLDQLPFFAKCGVARLLRELQQRGFNVCFQAV